jgi:hypothetical protein
VYVEPGSITFRLRPPSPVASDVSLIVQAVVLPPWDRENRVVVNGHDVGALTRSDLDPRARLRIAIPPEARVAGEAWTVTLGPAGRAGRVGWDVQWIALEDHEPRTGAPDPGVCPVLTCVDTGQGRTCEDAGAQSRSSS